jgi:PIN domain nuclease of toxin-antitoxin system
MNMFLIDTHVLLWYIKGDNKLSANTISIIDNPSNTIFVSKVCLWEIAIKLAIGKLSVNIPFDDLESFLEDKDFELLDFEIEDLSTLIYLPFYHSDPFDRLIIAQAINNDFTLISDDSKFEPYPVDLLRA